MENINKLLSVTVPAYNVEKYLERCLDSICIAADILEYVEVIVINDGSTDMTAQIAQRYVDAHPQTFRLITKENGGHGSAVNTGLENASGRFFIVLDGDDWLDAQALKKLIETIGGLQGREPELISYHYNRVSMQTGTSIPVKQKNIPYDTICKFDELPVHDIYFALASTCYQIKFLKDLGLRLQEHTYYVDVEYMLLPMPYVENVLFLDIFLYKYFVGNEEQSIYIPTMAARYGHHERVLRRVILELSKKTMGVRQKKYVRSILAQLLYTHYSIALLYETDHTKGLRNAKRFDAFLYQASPELYRDAWEQIPFLRIYRRYNFCERKVNHAYFYKIYMMCVYKKQSCQLYLAYGRKNIGWKK